MSYFVKTPKGHQSSHKNMALALLWSIFEYFKTICYNCIKWYTKRPRQDLMFIFIGLQGSGKSTAIGNMFGQSIVNSQHEHESSHESDDFIAELLSEDKTVRIAEAPGFSNALDTQSNAIKLASLSAYTTNKTNTDSIPTIVFVTAKLNDNRFAGKSSEFSKVVQAINLVKRDITDKACSNIVLLLTHGDRPDIQSTKQQRIKAYKETFKSVLKIDPVCVVVGNSVLSSSELERQLKEDNVGGKVCGLHALLLDYVKTLENKVEQSTFSKSNCKANYDDKKSKQLLNDLERNTVYSTKLQNKLQNSKRFNVCFPIGVTANYLAANGLGTHGQILTMSSSAKNKIFSLFPSDANILLKNQEYVALKDCKPGQRLYSVTGNDTIVTSLVPIYKNTFLDDGKLLFGRVFMVSETKGKGKKSRIHYNCERYNNGNFETCSLDLAPRLNPECAYYFYVEVNGGSDESFVVDDYLCYSKCDRRRTVL